MVVEHELIEFVLDDGRPVRVEFLVDEDGVTVCQAFEAQSEPEAETERDHWQSILNNFAAYVESCA